VCNVLHRAAQKHERDGILALILAGFALALPTKVVNIVTGTALLSLRNVYEGRVDVRLDFEAVDSTIAARLLRGYESDEALFVEEYLPGDADVIELGGGIGYVSSVVDSVLSENIEHHVLEPNPLFHDALEANRALNDANFAIHEFAYDPRNGSVSFYPAEVPTGGSTRICREEIQEVPATNLEDLTMQLGIEMFDLVCDIEQAEVDLLEDEMDYLEEHCRMVILEWHVDKELLGSLLDDTPFSEVDRRNGVYVLVNELVWEQ